MFSTHRTTQMVFLRTLYGNSPVWGLRDILCRMTFRGPVRLACSLTLSLVVHPANSDKGIILCLALYQERRPGPITMKRSHTSEQGRQRNTLVNLTSE